MVIDCQTLHTPRLIIALLLLLLGFSACLQSKSVREPPRERTCEGQLRRLGEALHRYRQEHGSVPPVVYVDPSGHKHSWRVVLLPYLEGLWAEFGKEEFDKYRFHEAWNSRNNVAWGKESGYSMSFRCLAETAYADDPRTSYLMLVRPQPEGAKRTRLPDDAVIVVESAGCGIKWFEPRDISIEELLETDCPFGVGRLNSLHPNVVKALRADGTVIDIPKNATRDEVRALLEGSHRSRESG